VEVDCTGIIRVMTTAPAALTKVHLGHHPFHVTIRLKTKHEYRLNYNGQSKPLSIQT